MSLKFYLCWCPKLSSINLCLFGDMGNALQQVSSHAQFITIWRTWIKFTFHAKVYLMGIWIKHCSLMMSLTRPFKIQNGIAFSFNHLEDVNHPKTRCNVYLASQLWPMLKDLPCAKTVYAHFIVIMQFSRSSLNSQYLSCFWFK